MSKEKEPEQGGCCGCTGCLVVIGILMALAGSWWAFIPFVLAAMIYSLLQERSEQNQSRKQDEKQREWWRL